MPNLTIEAYNRQLSYLESKIKVQTDLLNESDISESDKELAKSYIETFELQLEQLEKQKPK